jgi:hypothetical protein
VTRLALHGCDGVSGRFGGGRAPVTIRGAASVYKRMVESSYVGPVCSVFMTGLTGVGSQGMVAAERQFIRFCMTTLRSAIGLRYLIVIKRQYFVFKRLSGIVTEFATVGSTRMVRGLACRRVTTMATHAHIRGFVMVNGILGQPGAWGMTLTAITRGQRMRGGFIRNTMAAVGGTVGRGDFGMVKR